MKSYNYLVNHIVAVRDELIQALVSDRPFPEYEGGVCLRKASPSATLHELLAARDFSDPSRVMRLQYETFGDIDDELFRTFSFSPTMSVFRAWRTVHKEYFANFISVANSLIPHSKGVYTNEELRRVIEGLLCVTSRDKDGWRVREYKATNLISVAKTNKRILVGPREVRLSRRRLIGLLLHEIAIHVEWAEHPRHARGKGSEEAIGTLVEQLTLSRYHPLRMYRFLVIGFAIGLDGMPRNMRQTYHKVLSVRRVLKPEESEQAAELFVAKEVVRVFRNFPTDIPGLVYIRDKEYFEQNTQLWRQLVLQAPTLQNYELIVAPWRGKA